MARDAVGHVLERLRQRGVRMHIARDLLRREIPKLCQRQLGQQLGNLWPDHVEAQDLAVLGVRDELD